MHQPGQTYGVGDVLPNILLRDCTGVEFAVGDPRIAGDPVVIVSDCGDAPAQAPGEDAYGALQSAGAHLLRVVSGAPRPADEADPVYFDPENQLPQMFGFSQPSIIVISPSYRVEAILPDSALEAARALAAAHGGKETMRLGAGVAPVLVIPDVLDKPLIDRLIAYWNDSEPEMGAVSDAKGAAEGGAMRLEVKRRADVMVAEKQLFLDVKDRIQRCVIPMMQRAFGFECANMEALRVGCYDSADKGCFRRHRDNTTRFSAPRKFAMSLNLNTGEYEGGRLNFPEFGKSDYEAPPGAAVVFSCSLLHEAMEVTAGRRFALFTFFTDKEGVKMMAELRRQNPDVRAKVAIN